MNILSFMFFGALFRRIWGGWFAPNAILKRVAGYVLAGFVGWYVFGFTGMAEFVMLIMGTCWWFDIQGVKFLSHGWSQGMGFGWPRPWWQCFLSMTVRYGLYCTWPIGLVWGGHSGSAYAAMCIIPPIGYTLSWMFLQKLPKWCCIKPNNCAFDGATTYGECILGATIVGGLPLAAWIGHAL